MSTYDSHEPSSPFGLWVAVAFLGALSLGGGAFWFLQRSGEGEASPEVISPVAEEADRQPPEKAQISRTEGPGSQPDDREKEEGPTEVPSRAKTSTPVADSGESIGRSGNSPPAEDEPTAALAAWSGADPAVLLEEVARTLADGRLTDLPRLLGAGTLEEDHLRTLKEFADNGRVPLAAARPIREIGELEANRRVRWALAFEESAGGELQFDFIRQKGGDWAVERVRLREESGPNAIPTDALGTAAFFLEAVLRQEFEVAQSVVDTGEVSDAKIAALCVVFEEAKYQLREKRPLQAMFERERTAGFIAHVEHAGGDKAADFGLSLRRPPTGTGWQIAEINLDRLLIDYADRVAGGDVHYTPLVKNPGGGDTLILYFGFDEDDLMPRTRRQLEIVAELLKLNGEKMLTLSGHTDSLGTREYNQKLSARRAKAVENFLVDAGVPKSQIVSFAEGEAKPRVPNATEDGQDHPEGRRANRRTEIYLDF